MAVAYFVVEDFRTQKYNPNAISYEFIYFLFFGLMTDYYFL